MFVESPGLSECSSSLEYDQSVTETRWEVNRYGSTNREYFSFVLWTVVDSDSDIELRISSLGFDSSSVNLYTLLHLKT